MEHGGITVVVGNDGVPTAVVSDARKEADGAILAHRIAAAAAADVLAEYRDRAEAQFGDVQ